MDMTQPTAEQFDIYQFEDRIQELLLALRRLRSENQALLSERSEQQRRNGELKQRLESIIERLRRFEELHPESQRKVALS